jgi:hypothetical protein
VISSKEGFQFETANAQITISSTLQLTAATTISFWLKVQ